MDTLAIFERGQGPDVVLVHGGAGPKTTWAGMDSLTFRWKLVQVYRRGFDPSPPAADGRQDFLVDAEDLAAIFRARRPHVVAHSYGTLGTLLAAGRAPETVRSLTLIEPPLYYLAADDPAVARLKFVGDMVLTEGLDSDPEALREFLVLSGAPGIGGGELPAQVASSVRRALGGRLPGEARPELAALRAAAVPALVASGAHTPALESICDGLAAALGAQRVVAPGAGHFVAAAPGFTDRLDRFLTGADGRTAPL
ncbi:alpha/beta fold hydrolase [Nocardia inohanensis]|uniref:alpha/beta fold hydrolase n=1 Tax=Nocardia inohanensis TaxID=209246 RepID=UPI0008325F7E|nr:alpha/beta hydrolase [Nocardia inohanensis]